MPLVSPAQKPRRFTVTRSNCAPQVTWVIREASKKIRRPLLELGLQQLRMSQENVGIIQGETIIDVGQPVISLGICLFDNYLNNE